nr:GntR family transcriptional regulator [Clostridium chromiireducens]
MIKYQQIASHIKEHILSGEYKPNEQLPFEKELCERFSASRMTVKKALDLLVAEGLVVKRRGSGSFIKDITEGEIQEIIRKKQFSGLTNTSLGHEVTSKVLEFKIINADEKIARTFKIDNGDFVYFIHRVRYVDKEPIVIEKTYMPLSIAEGIKKEDVNGSIYNFLQKKLGLKIQSAHSTVRVSKADEFDKEYLLLMDGDPIAEVEKVVYLENGKAFEYSFSRHRYDNFEFKAITVI